MTKDVVLALRKEGYCGCVEGRTILVDEDNQLIRFLYKLKRYAIEHQYSYDRITQQFALDYPEVVDDYELVDNFVFRDNETNEPIEGAMIGYIFHNNGSEPYEITLGYNGYYSRNPYVVVSYFRKEKIQMFDREDDARRYMFSCIEQSKLRRLL